MRAALSVIVGYATMFVAVMVSFTVLYLILGTDGAFKSGSYEASGTWIALSFVLGFGAAVAGGFVCALIARSSTGPMILIGLVIVLGLVMAVMTVMASDSGPAVREGDLDNFEAMQNAKTPAWVAFLNPFVGAVGIFVGARLVKPKPA